MSIHVWKRLQNCRSRDGVSRRQHAEVPHRGEGNFGGAIGGPRIADCGRAGCGAHSGNCSPRSEARESAALRVLECGSPDCEYTYRRLPVGLWARTAAAHHQNEPSGTSRHKWSHITSWPFFTLQLPRHRPRPPTAAGRHGGRVSCGNTELNSLINS